MKRKMRKQGGFTLVELMIVVVIVGILAAVAVPLYRGNVKRAMATEGAALLGSVRTAERVYYAEHESYQAVAEDDSGGSSDPLGISTAGNKYFTTYSVTVSGATFDGQTIGTGDASTIKVTMDEDGVVTYDYDYSE